MCECDMKEDIREIKTDVKALLVDVAVLKLKSGFFGLVGGAIMIIAVYILEKLGMVTIWK